MSSVSTAFGTNIFDGVLTIILMVEELWSKVTLRNRVMEIAESIAPHFKSYQLDEKGNIARFISVKNIEFKAEFLGEVIQYRVDIEFLSDQGSWHQPVIIREFTAPHQFDAELMYYDKLEQRCLLIDNLQPVRRIEFDRETLRVVYEGSHGHLLNDLAISQELKDFQLGALAAYLQSGDGLDVEIDSFKAMVNYLIEQVDMTPEEKEIILDLIKHHYTLIQNSHGGYDPVTVFDPSYFRFLRLIAPDEVTKQKISQNEAFLIEIIPLQPHETITDRMTDVALYYGEEAFAEFVVTKTVDKIKEQLVNFFEGYELAMEKLTMLSLEEMYPSGLTLDLHMLVLYWLLLNHMSEADKMEINHAIIIEYTHFLLLHHPFQMYSSSQLSTTEL